MKRVIKVFLYVFAVVICISVVGISYLYFAFPKVSPPENITVDVNDKMIERGKYLANHVAVCVDCHSTRDWTKFSGPIVKGTEGQGGELFGKKIGLPGDFYAKNITSYGIGDWTDGEIYRSIVSGVDKDGEPLFPIMPYKEYEKMNPEDVKAIIAYLRSLEPIKKEIPESNPEFPINLIMRTIPNDIIPGEKPEEKDTLAYGEYMASIAGCAHCHTPQEKGQPIEGMRFAGGFNFPLESGGFVKSSNLTPDNNTGIGFWNLDNFLTKFDNYNDVDSLINISKNEFNTVMPWSMYAGMSKKDLSAIFYYLKSLKPVNNRIEKFTVE